MFNIKNNVIFGGYLQINKKKKIRRSKINAKINRNTVVQYKKNALTSTRQD